MSLFNRKNDEFSRKNDKQVEQLRSEFTGYIQVLQQNLQTLQQNLTEELQQLKQTEEIREQNLAKEMRQLKQQRVSYWSTAQSTIDQVQRQVRELSRKVSRLVPDPLPPSEKNLGELHALDIDKAQIASNAVVDYGATHQNIEQTFVVAAQKRDNARETIRASMENLFSPIEQHTDPMHVINPEEEEDTLPKTDYEQANER